MQWNVEKSGPLIATCPLAYLRAHDLDQMERKKVKIGGLTAIVPTRMVTINSHFTEAPNLYDGLPRDAKILYLLTLLNDDQWRKITGDGLALGDCQGDQVAVMQSILPNPFKWIDVTLVAPNGWTSSQDPPHQLSDADRSQVKLRVVHRLELILPLVNNGGWTGTSVRGPEKKGSVLPSIKDDDGDEFGQHVRIESDNVPKRSELDTRGSRFGSKIALKSGEKLSELLARVSSATGVQIAADPHYAPMRMYELGSEASARDLIQALALGVAGAYRHLGNFYVLTCDLEGVAAHQARIAAWEDDLEKLVSQRRDLWRSVLAKGKELGKVKFNPGAYDSLTSAELDNMAANDKVLSDNNNHYIDTGLASDAVRLEIQEFQGGRNNNIDTHKVGLSSSTQCEMVLPDGTKMWNKEWLGGVSQFNPNPWTWEPQKPDPVALPFTTPNTLRAIVLHADSTQAAREEVAHVSRLGVNELWLDTSKPNVLEAAVMAATSVGVKVVPVIRPWALEPVETTRDPDRTVTGDFGRSFASKKLNYVSWQKFWQDISAYEPPTPVSISPLDQQVPARWARFASLAAVKGISGIALLDTYPIGYARDISRSTGSYFYNGAMDNFLSYGYSEAQRAAFFFSDHVDPLDLENQSARTNVNFQSVWGEGWTVGEPFAKWQKAKALWIHDAMQNLVTQLSGAGVPIMLPGQPIKAHLPPYGKTYLFHWLPESDLPTSPEDYMGDAAAKATDVAVVEIQDDPDPDQHNRVASAVQKQFTKSGKPVVLDFSGVPPSKLDFVLKSWLKR